MKPKLKKAIIVVEYNPEHMESLDTDLRQEVGRWLLDSDILVREVREVEEE